MNHAPRINYLESFILKMLFPDNAAVQKLREDITYILVYPSGVLYNFTLPGKMPWDTTSLISGPKAYLHVEELAKHKCMDIPDKPTKLCFGAICLHIYKTEEKYPEDKFSTRQLFLLNKPLLDWYETKEREP